MSQHSDMSWVRHEQKRREYNMFILKPVSFYISFEKGYQWKIRLQDVKNS